MPNVKVTNTSSERRLYVELRDDDGNLVELDPGESRVIGDGYVPKVFDEDGAWEYASDANLSIEPSTDAPTEAAPSAASEPVAPTAVETTPEPAPVPDVAGADLTAEPAPAPAATEE